MSTRTLRNPRFVLCAAMLLAATAAGAQPKPGPVATQALFDELAEKDRMLFDAVFNACDLQALGSLVTEDFEFFHDKGGLIATSGAQFVELIRSTCERQKSGEDYRARRELVAGSLEVYPLNNYGAVQVGVHRFYRKMEGQPDKLTETARFTHVWKKDRDGWRIARALSYDHRLAE